MCPIAIDIIQYSNKISVKIRMWLGVPRNLTNIAFYGHLTKLRLPLSSLVEEYQDGHDSAWLY